MSNIDDDTADRLTREVAFIVPPHVYEQLEARARAKGHRKIPPFLRALLKQDEQANVVPPRLEPQRPREIKVPLTPKQHADVLQRASMKNYRSPSEYMRALIDRELDDDIAPTTRARRILQAALPPQPRQEDDDY